MKRASYHTAFLPCPVPARNSVILDAKARPQIHLHLTLIFGLSFAYISCSMTLTKEKIAENISRQCGISKTQARRLLEWIMEEIKTTLASGEDVMITGFGKFMVNDKKARRGRNPQNAEELLLDARRVVRFNCSGVLKEKLNKT